MSRVHNFLKDEVEALSFKPLSNEIVPSKIKLANKGFKQYLIDPRSDFPQRSSPFLWDYMYKKAVGATFVGVVL